IELQKQRAKGKQFFVKAVEKKPTILQPKIEAARQRQALGRAEFARQGRERELGAYREAKVKEAQREVVEAEPRFWSERRVLAGYSSVPSGEKTGMSSKQYAESMARYAAPEQLSVSQPQVDWSRVTVGQVQASGYQDISSWRRAVESGQATPPTMVAPSGVLGASATEATLASTQTPSIKTEEPKPLTLKEQIAQGEFWAALARGETQTAQQIASSNVEALKKLQPLMYPRETYEAPKLGAYKPDFKPIKESTIPELLAEGQWVTAAQIAKQQLKQEPDKEVYGTDLGKLAASAGISFIEPALSTGQTIAAIGFNKPTYTLYAGGKETKVLGATETKQMFKDVGKTFLKSPESFARQMVTTTIEDYKASPTDFVSSQAGSFFLFKGVGDVAGIVSKGVGRATYTTKGVLQKTPIKIAFQESKGATIGTIRTDIVSKLAKRKTFDISDITSKDIAKALTQKGKAQYLRFDKSERELFERATTGKEAKFIKQQLKELGIKEEDIVGFTAESGKATGLIEKLVKKGEVSFEKAQSEPYGKFAASRTATAPLVGQGESEVVKFSLFPKIPKAPSITVTVGKFKKLSISGGIEKTIARLGFDISKTSKELQTYFRGALKSGARPSKLKEMRALVGKKAVSAGKVESEVKGFAVSSPSRLFGLTGEEEFVYSFGTRTEVLGSLKQRLFSPAVVKVQGKRFLLNVKRTIAEEDALVKNISSVGRSAGEVTSKVPQRVRYISVGDKALLGLGLSRKQISESKIPISKQVSLLSKGISKPISKPISKSASISISKSVSKPISISISKGISEPITQPVSKTISVPSTKLSLGNVSSSLKSKPISKPISKIVSKPITTPVYNLPTTKVTPPPTITRTKYAKPIKQFSRIERQATQAFDVFVRKQGKLKLVAKGLPERLATLKGLQTVEKYTQRTTVLRKAGYTTIKDIPAISKRFEARFREPTQKSSLRKLGDKVLIEKSLAAISSYEEKLGIPYKAMRLKKQKTFLKNLTQY
ncbi:MAG: hypothetical protein H7836_15420, partial [Magnetococcus sp. YQC-3]